MRCARSSPPSVPPTEVDEARIAEHLYTAGQPDADLIIRTGGEQRTSNFLLWQGALRRAGLHAHPVAGLRARPISTAAIDGVRPPPAPLRRPDRCCAPAC